MSVTTPAPLTDAQPVLTKTTVYLTRQRKRVEVTAVGGSFRKSIATITCPDLGQVITIDSELKIYKVEPIHTILQMLAFPDFIILSRSSDADHWSNITGISGQQQHGIQTVDGMPTTRYSLGVHNADATGSGTASDVKMDYWVTDLNTGYSISVSGQIQEADGSTVTYDISGDHNLIDRLNQKMPVRIIIHSPGRPDTLMDMINYSVSPIDPSNFDKPDNFMEVSPDEYAQMQMKEVAPPEVFTVPLQPSRT